MLAGWWVPTALGSISLSVPIIIVFDVVVYTCHVADIGDNVQILHYVVSARVLTCSESSVTTTMYKQMCVWSVRKSEGGWDGRFPC